MEYGAIDLHTKESEIRIIEAGGGVVLERRIATTRERLTAVFGSRPPMRVLLESGTGSEWVAQHLEGFGHEVVVADPNYTPMYGSRTRRIKTDRRDVAALAEANRRGVYRRAHRVSAAQRDIRRRLRVRDQLVHVRRQAINLLRAQLRAEGVRVATGAAETFVERFERSAVSPATRAAMAPLRELLAAVAPLITRAEQWTRSAAGADVVTRRLMTAPGVGPVIALAYRATIDDVGRFTAPGAVASYLGLVPREDSWRAAAERGHHEGGPESDARAADSKRVACVAIPPRQCGAPRLGAATGGSPRPTDCRRRGGPTAGADSVGDVA